MTRMNRTPGETVVHPVFARLYATPRARRDSERDRVLVEAVENLARAMEARGVNGAELARRAGWTRSMVSRLLQGEHSCTVRSLSDAFHALGYEMSIGYRLPTGSPQVQAVPRERVPKTAKRSRGRRRAG
jgi:hypothetical protein